MLDNQRRVDGTLDLAAGTKQESAEKDRDIGVLRLPLSISQSYCMTLPVHAGADHLALALRALMIEHANGWSVRSRIGKWQCFRCATEFGRYPVAAEEFATACNQTRILLT